MGVGPFTLGLFAPLPLAMMIPFMATQSLAMGEAFGKSFQYGKRKISSMSNEEFNKLSLKDLMDEQTANIKSLIPKLHEQMADSQSMQQDIFREMTKLIPAFINGLGQGVGDILGESTGDTPLGNINIPKPNIQPASATSDQDQSQSTIINISHGSESTQEQEYHGSGDDLHGTDGEITTDDTNNTSNRRKFKNEIANHTKYTLKQMLKKEPPYTSWKLTLINKKLKELSPTPTPSPTYEKPLNKQEEAQKLYLTKVVDFRKLIITYQNYIGSLGSGAQDKSLKHQLTGKLGTAQAKLRNYITQSRNNILLKSVANRDWNDRIWK